MLMRACAGRGYRLGLLGGLGAVVLGLVPTAAHGEFMRAPEPTAGVTDPVVQPAPPAEPRARSVVLYSTRGDSMVHVLDARDLAPIASVPIGVGAHELVISPDGRWALGTAYGGPGPNHQPADSRVAIWDLREGRLHRTVDVKPKARPNDAAFSPDGVHAFVTVEAPPAIIRLNVDTGEHTSHPLKHPANHMLALSRDGTRLYVAHMMPGGVTILDADTMEVLGRVEVPVGAEGIAVTPDGSRVWVACNRSDRVVIVDPEARKIEREVTVEGFPFRLRIAPDGRTVAVSLPKSDEVALIDSADPTLVRRVSVRADEPGAMQGVPTSIAFTPDGASVVVVAAGPASEIVLIDVAEGVVKARHKAQGPIPDAIATGVASVPTTIQTP